MVRRADDKQRGARHGAGYVGRDERDLHRMRTRCHEDVVRTQQVCLGPVISPNFDLAKVFEVYLVVDYVGALDEAQLPVAGARSGPAPGHHKFPVARWRECRVSW